VSFSALPAKKQNGLFTSEGARAGDLSRCPPDPGGHGPAAGEVADADSLLGEEAPDPPGGVAWPPGGPWHGAGHGFAAWPAVALRLSISAVEADRLPRAADIARIAAVDLAAGRGVAPAKALPVYLRDDVVHRR